jgi:hypothetical protein
MSKEGTKIKFAYFISGNLADWKSGLIDPTIDGTTVVVSLEIEVDNWVVQTEAYVDDVTVSYAP